MPPPLHRSPATRATLARLATVVAMAFGVLPSTTSAVAEALGAPGEPGHDAPAPA